MDKSNICKF